MQKKSEAPEDAYLRPDQLVDRYCGSITLRTLARWRTDGEGPDFIKIGRRIVYPLADVRAWEEERRLRPRQRRRDA